MATRTAPDQNTVLKYFRIELLRFSGNVAITLGVILAVFGLFFDPADMQGLLLTAGCAVLALGAGFFQRHCAKRRALLYADLETNGAPHSARVISLDKELFQWAGGRKNEMHGDNRRQFRVRYSFTGPSGALIEGEMAHLPGVLIKGLRVDDTIPIIVDPHDPSRTMGRFWADLANEDDKFRSERFHQSK